MCMKLPLRDLNSYFYSPHSINIYTYKVITASKVRDDNKCLKSYQARFILALLLRLIFLRDRERKDECNFFFWQKQTSSIYLTSCTYRVNSPVKSTPYVQANLYHLSTNDKCKLQIAIQWRWSSHILAGKMYSRRWTFKSIPVNTCYCICYEWWQMDAIIVYLLIIIYRKKL